jgi:DDE superfamily endonuclease
MLSSSHRKIHEPLVTGVSPRPIDPRQRQENCETRETPQVRAWLAQNPQVSFHFTPIGSSWINQIEIWFGIITRQSIRRGTFASVTVLIKTIRDYITHWNSNSRPFQWTATADEILAKVQLTQQNIRNLVDNNRK